MDEKEFEEILNFVSKSKYPENIKSKDSRSNWRKKCRPFTCCKDELFYNHKKYGTLLVVKGIKEKKRIIESSHLQHDGRHHGINRTLKKISTNYYWRTIAKDVHGYVKVECAVCVGQAAAAAVAGVQQGPREGMEGVEHAKDRIVDRAMEQIGLDVIGTILEPGAPSPPTASNTFKCEAVPTPTSTLALPIPSEQAMARCGLDLLGPLAETHKGRRFIAVLTDSATGWAEAVALTEATTEAVGAFLAEVVGRHGAVEELLARPSQEEFCIRLSERVYALMGLSVRVLGVVDSPGSWHNSLLCGALTRLSDTHRYTWDLLLPPALLSYRSFPQTSRAACPFTLLYGRPVRLPSLAPPLPPSGAQDEVTVLVEHMAEYIKGLAGPPHHFTPSTNQTGSQFSPTFQAPNTGPFPPAVVSVSTPASQPPAAPVLSTTHNTAMYTIPATTGISTHTMCAPPPPLPAPPPPPAAASTAGSLIVSTSATSLPVHTATDAHASHMVMIHTDGKAYTDSFYVICPQ
ncbi:hypothetical protein O3P69_013885 [Scylla paramamosain]|uniref:RNA-directed DNA polymerase n=1 Tax=Scylla paramamosain TaxID=85552 RepID=A0AAW0SS36_SCYPA